MWIENPVRHLGGYRTGFEPLHSNHICKYQILPLSATGSTAQGLPLLAVILRATACDAATVCHPWSLLALPAAVCLPASAAAWQRRHGGRGSLQPPALNYGGAAPGGGDAGRCMADLFSGWKEKIY